MAPHGFSKAEKAQCVIWSIEGYGDTAVQRRFRTKYKKSAPSRDSIRRWVTQYRSGGDHSHGGGNGRPQITDEQKAAIRQVLENNARVSLRDAERQTGVSKSTIQRYFRNELHVFPYKLQVGPQLSDQDKQARVHFAQSCLSKMTEDAGYLKRIIYSDECSFSLCGGVNKQNCRIWGTERPQEVYEVPQGADSIMVWCAISSRGIIRPYFFENVSVTGESYKKMLRYFFFPKLRDYPQDVIFQQDGAPPHFAIPVRQYLNQKLGNRWIGRGGPVAWPPRSPDLTPCDFFLWGYIKDRVFSNLPSTISELKTRIRAVISSITEETLQKVVENTEFRMRLLLRQNGAHFENLLN